MSIAELVFSGGFFSILVLALFWIGRTRRSKAECDLLHRGIKDELLAGGIRSDKIEAILKVMAEAAVEQAKVLVRIEEILKTKTNRWNGEKKDDQPP